MHCSPLNGPPDRSMDDSHIGVPASTARRGPGMKTCCLAVVDLPGHDVTGRSQRSHYIRVKVVYVVRPLRLFLALQCMSFPLHPSIIDIYI
jgi:hypothetical protein